jgi:hypothetical protein
MEDRLVPSGSRDVGKESPAKNYWQTVAKNGNSNSNRPIEQNSVWQSPKACE